MKLICTECGAEFAADILYVGDALADGEAPCIECPRCGAVFGCESEQQQN